MIIEQAEIPPSWMSRELLLDIEDRASLALPNEFFAFLIRAGSNIKVAALDAEASPTNFKVDPNALVSFCHQLDQNHWTVCATVHSHPQGQNRFSKEDAQLALWAELHLLLVYDGCMWSPIWGRNGKTTAK